MTGTEKLKIIREKFLNGGEVSQREIEEFRNLSIDEVLMKQEYVEKLNAMGVFKISDFEKVSIGEVNDACNYNRDQKKVLNEILGKLGIKIYARHTSEFNSQKSYNKKSKRVLDFEALSEEEKQKFLDKPIETLDLGKQSIAILKQNGIITMRDLAEKRHQEIRELLKRTNRKTKFALEIEKYNFKMAEAYKLRGPLSFTDPKIDIKKVNEMSDEELKEFMLRPLSDIGFSQRLSQLFFEKAGVENIGDLVKVTKSDSHLIVNKNVSLYRKLISRMREFGLSFSYKRKIEKVESKYSPVDLMQVSKKEKQEVLKRSLEDIGIMPYYAKRLNEAGYYTLGDLAGTTYAGLSAALSNNSKSCRYVENILKSYNIYLKKNIYNAKRTEISAPQVDVSKLTEEQKQAFYKIELDKIGLKENTIQHLKSSGFRTIGDIIGVKKSDFEPKYGLARESVIDLEKTLIYYGIKIKGTHMSLIDGELKLGGKYSFLDDYTARKIKPETYKSYTTDEQKKTFMQRGVAQLGLPVSAVKRLNKRNIVSIADMLRLTDSMLKRDVFAGNVELYDETKRILEEYGLELAPYGSKYKTIKEQRETYIDDTSLMSFGLDKNTVTELKKRMGITTLRQLLNANSRELISAFEYDYNKLFEIYDCLNEQKFELRNKPLNKPRINKNVKVDEALNEADELV